MEYTVGAVNHGFEITEIRQLEELDSRYVRMRHVRSGADLVWLDSGDENMVFSIAFKTVPEDDTGVFHIIEHSVLCGSENYPVKEPFAEMLKCSLNTYLNALTYPDRTAYPVASRNRKDFLNLSCVYLDAVFRPAMQTNPNIFRQEGWHYQQDENGEITVNGVVFNEMKGAYASVDRVVSEELSRRLYPDNCYGRASGGDPDHIPGLTFEKFVETYRRFYHPSNSYIYLDGDVPMDELLEIMDSQYLGCCERQETPVTILPQVPVESCETECFYELSDKDAENKDVMLMGKILCGWDDRVRQLAATVLGIYLTENSDSPLEKAIIDAGLGTAVSMGLDDGALQQNYYLLIRNTSRSKREEIYRTITETAEKILAEGIDTEALSAIIDRIEFALLCSDSTKGLNRACSAMSSWMFGGDPVLYLTHGEVIAELREKLRGDYFPQLLSELLVERRNTVTVWGIPVPDYGAEVSRRQAEKIAQTAAGWSSEERERIAEISRELERWQSTPDSEEALAKMPRLQLSDINPLPPRLITEEEKSGDTVVLRHPAELPRVTFCSFYFNLSDLSVEEITALNLMAELMGSIPTENYTQYELNKRLKSTVGKLSADVCVFAAKGQTQAAMPCYVLTCSALNHKIDSSLELVEEILHRTRYDALEYISRIVVQCCDSKRRSMVSEGHRYGMYRTLAPYSAESELNENLSGYSYLCYLKKLKDDPGEVKRFADLAMQLARKVFCRARLTVSIASNADIPLQKLLDIFPAGSGDSMAQMVPKLGLPRHESIAIPSRVSYAALGVNVATVGAEYRSELSLLAHIASYNYLWNAIRIQGGAYGTGMLASEKGSVFLYSYRDPDSSRSLEVFRRIPEFVREFCAAEGSLDNDIIGCMANFDPLLSAKEKIAAADRSWFCGITYEDKCRRWSELLSADRSKLLELADVLERALEKASVCVIGSREIIDSFGAGQLTPMDY